MWDNGSVYLQFRVHVSVKLMALAKARRSISQQVVSFPHLGQGIFHPY